jgi:hypothetical protein
MLQHPVIGKESHLHRSHSPAIFLRQAIQEEPFRSLKISTEQPADKMLLLFLPVFIKPFIGS